MRAVEFAGVWMWLDGRLVSEALDQHLRTMKMFIAMSQESADVREPKYPSWFRLAVTHQSINRLESSSVEGYPEEKWYLQQATEECCNVAPN